MCHAGVQSTAVARGIRGHAPLGKFLRRQSPNSRCSSHIRITAVTTTYTQLSLPCSAVAVTGCGGGGHRRKGGGCCHGTAVTSLRHILVHSQPNIMMGRLFTRTP